jgi:hypothetical protein
MDIAKRKDGAEDDLQKRRHRMTLVRKISATVALCTCALVSFVAGSTSKAEYPPTCVSAEPLEEVICPGWRGGDGCPDMQSWQVCGDECTSEPDENAWYCEKESATTCKGCGEEAEGSILRARNVGSCYC